MRAVPIGELKNNLSAYLQKVRAGQEIIIRNRNVPVAKIVPLDTSDLDLEEQALVAEGLMIPPKKKFDPEKFFAIGRGVRMGRVTEKALQRIVDQVREDADAGVLGHKRARPRVRSRSNKPAR